MGDLNSPQPGPQNVTDGQPLDHLRSERTGGLVVQQVHAPYAEETIRGATWTTSTPIAGITVTALMLVSVASSIAIVGIYNPVGSGVNAVVQKVVAVNQGSTAITFVLGASNQPAMTVANGLATAINNFTQTTGNQACRNFAGATACAGTPLPIRYIGGSATGAVTAGTVECWTEYLDGDIVVAPGNFLGLFSVLVGGVVNASMTWSEVPV